MTRLYRRDRRGELHFVRVLREGDAVVEYRARVGRPGARRAVEAEGAPDEALARAVADARREGYAPFDGDSLRALSIELPIQGQGCNADVARRLALEEFLAALLERTGLGEIVEAAARRGAMVVMCAVVDLEVAERSIRRALLGTEFDDYESVA